MPALDGLIFVEGEMAARLARLDTAAWPEDLHAAIAMCMASPSPTLLWCGDERSLVYNDAAIPLLGHAHPIALGCSDLATFDARWRFTCEDVERVRSTRERLFSDLLTLTPLLDRSGAVIAVIGTTVVISQEIGDDEHASDTPDARPRILLVHRDVNVLTQWQSMLDRHCDVVTARDRASAAACVAASHPDLIITDDSDDAAVLHRLRDMPAARHVPIVLVTSPTRLADASADDYLVRSFSARELRNRIRLQLALTRRRVDDVRSAAQDRDDFLSMVGHELRNPLSTISTMVQALLMRGPSTELSLIERGATRMTHLVDDLLESARLSRGTIQLHTKVTEIAHVVDRALESVNPLLTRAKQQVIVGVPRVDCRVLADADRLVRALVNVLTNAIQHTPTGRRIFIEAVCEEKMVRLTVSDEGDGIAPERLPHVFQAFQANRTSGGLGLGLAIARHLIELHGGTIALASKGTGAATLCTIELPLSVAAADTAPRTERRKLLLVEDDDDAARSLKSALEELGYEVAVAHDGPIALNLARTFHPDVALLDLGLPIMDGWELARRLRASIDRLPLVAVTARDQEADKQRSAEVGFIEHLVKPIDLPVLQRIVNRVSASRRGVS